jgi:hypothetical protein
MFTSRDRDLPLLTQGHGKMSLESWLHNDAKGHSSFLLSSGTGVFYQHPFLYITLAAFHG